MDEEVTEWLKVLSRGPNDVVKRYSGYVISGYRFHTTIREARLKTQNSGVTLEAVTQILRNAKDENPKKIRVTYYGAIKDIIELDYYGHEKYVLFKCDWFVDEKDKYGSPSFKQEQTLCSECNPQINMESIENLLGLSHGDANSSPKNKTQQLHSSTSTHAPCHGKQGINEDVENDDINDEIQEDDVDSEIQVDDVDDEFQEDGVGDEFQEDDTNLDDEFQEDIDLDDEFQEDDIDGEFREEDVDEEFLEEDMCDEFQKDDVGDEFEEEKLK
ncbi:uncharacterized protein LOC131614487 [Vicia villosa]|uniref:uncharacterized protein LOC131614487 n=1 Tax=Vicia villosa TaxID=3911 RepID=UPI00273B338E|nr:uncharacterized protein LOC131614487 [Vicia villosa]